MEKKKVIKNVIDNIAKISIKVSGVIGNRGKNSYTCSICKAYEETSNFFVSFRKKPKDIKKYVVNYNITKNIKSVAIVIQGPLKKEDDFTLQTVMYYKKMYPLCDVIVSTWEDEDKRLVQRIREAGAIVILNAKPLKTGLGNVNFQLVSTKQGIDYALKKTDKKYILKTRSDQRIVKPHFLEYFIGLLEQFPISQNEYQQNKRILVHQGSTGGNMFIPYFISDFLYFGDKDDMAALFALKLDDKISMSYKERSNWIQGLTGKVSVDKYYQLTAPEIYIIEEYIKFRTGKKPDRTVEKYWEFMRNYMISISWDDISLFWYKYNSQNESELFRLYEERDNERRYLQYTWTFQNWFNLYSGMIEYKKEFEKIKEELSY